MVQNRELLVADPGAGAEPATPFLDHDAAFLVHLLRIQCEPACEVGECVQPVRHDLGRVSRQLEHVNGFVEAGVRVHVRTEAGARALEVRDELARLEMRAPVERHVLEEVSEAPLILGFEQ